MKQFPRLHSLSTLGLIHHQEFNYRFHPLRTDFIGDSGTGKSMISDLLQLIFVGSEAFESATKGTDERKPSGMVLQRAGKGTDIGYAFLNLEIKKDQFICIGVYIESTGSHTEAFIVQRGYGFDILAPFEKPLETKDFLKNEDILPLDVLKDHLEEQALVCESWKKVKSYHEILYNNHLLPLNLAENDKTLKDFAQIIQSFSRGKTLETNKSTSLKSFLFGNNKAKIIFDKFKDAVRDFESEMGEYGRNRQEINRVTSKQRDYVELKQKKDDRDELQRVWLEHDFLYKHQNQNRLLKNLKESVSNYQQASLFLEQVQTWAISEKSRITEISEKQDGKVATAKEIYDQSVTDYKRLQKAQKLLVDLDCTAESFQRYYELNQALLNQNHTLKSVRDHLVAQGLQSYFEENQWPDTYQEFRATVENKQALLQKELGIKNILKGYADLTNPGSLGYWALHQGRALSWEEESTLVHFQNLPRTKPDNRKPYLPSPEELIRALSVAETEEDGFWLNLNGIRTFVAYSPDRIFDITDKEKIKSYFDSFSQKLDAETDALQQKITQLSALQNLFEAFEHPKKFYETYRKPNPELPEQEVEEFNLSLEEFQEYMRCLKQQESITKTFKQADEDYQQVLTKQKETSDKKKNLEAISEMLDVYPDTLGQKNEEPDSQTDISSQLNEIFEKHGNKAEVVPDQNFEELEFENITRSIIGHQQKLHVQSILDLSTKLQTANEKLDDVEKTCLKYYNQLPDLKECEGVEIEEPTKQREAYITAETAYHEHYSYIIKTYLSADSHRFGDKFDFLELGESLLPEALRDQAITEKNIIDKIQYYLNEINEKNRQITSRKIQKIKTIVDEVDTTVSEQLDTARRIDNFFTADEKRITGGYQVRLNRKFSDDYPKSWIDTFKNAVENQMSLFSDNSNKDLTNELALERSLEEVMTKAFYACGGSKNVKVDIPRLLDPASYYNLIFSMESSTGRTNIGSTGQTYAAISLLCIARLSVIGRKESERQKDGIRFMPIDEAEGLGSNFELLYDIAKDYDYQIISMSVGSVGRFKEGSQYVYILHKNTDEDDPVNFPPMPIWSKAALTDE